MCLGNPSLVAAGRTKFSTCGSCSLYLEKSLGYAALCGQQKRVSAVPEVGAHWSLQHAEKPFEAVAGIPPPGEESVAGVIDQVGQSRVQVVVGMYEPLGHMEAA